MDALVHTHTVAFNGTPYELRVFRTPDGLDVQAVAEGHPLNTMPVSVAVDIPDNLARYLDSDTVHEALRIAEERLKEHVRRERLSEGDDI